MNALTTFQFWFVAVELLVLLTFFGYPIAQLAGRWSGGRVAVSAPLLGFCVCALLSWYWVRATGLGLDVGVPVMVGVAALGWVPVLLGLLRHRPSWRELTRRGALPMATIFAVAILFTIHYASVFRLDRLSSAAGINIDVTGYPLVADQLIDDGLSGTGNIYGFDLAALAEGDAFGATELVAVAAVVSGMETWEVGTAVLFVAIFLLALQLGALIRRLWPQAGPVSVLAALAGVASPLFVYLAFAYFLSQILAISLLCGLLVALLAALDAGSWRAVAASIAVTALIGAAMVATYPHMALLSPVVMLPAVIACVRRTAWRLQLGRMIGVAVGGAALAIALAPDQFEAGIRRAQALGEVAAGWPLPAFLPDQLIADIPYWGPSASPGASPRAWVVSALIVALLLGCAALRGIGDRLARFVVVTWVVVLTSYALVYMREGGDTYRQWKWITFFLPLLVACAAALVGAAGLDLARRARVRPAVALAGAAAALVLLVSFQTSRAHTWVRPWLGGAAPNIYVKPDLAALPAEPRIRALAGVNLNFPDPIESRWLSLLLRPRVVYPYPPPPGIGSPWTLEHAGSRASGPGVEVIPINATYQLVREGRPPPATARAG